MQNLLRDVKYACRLFANKPLVPLVVIVTLSLGIGVNTAAFSAINAILLRPLPYATPGNIVVLSEANRQLSELQVSYPDYLDWEKQTKSFSSLSAFQPDRMNLNGLNRLERMPACRISSRFLSTLGVRPVLGRDLSASDDRLGAEPVALISNGYWHVLGGKGSVLGQTITLDDTRFVIVGVLPANFRLMLADQQPVIYVPIGLSADRLNDRRRHAGIWAIGRLKPNVSLRQSQAELAAVARNLERAYPATNTDLLAVVKPLAERVVRDSKLVLLIVFAAVGFVLLIACANVANLMLAWGSTREREISLRGALGATQKSLFAQLIVENVMLALIGGSLGVLFSIFGVGAIGRLMPDSLRETVDIRIDAVVLVYAAGLSGLTGLLFGCVPALRLSRLDLNSSLRTSASNTGGGRSRNRFRNGLIVAEVGLTVVLLVSAQLMSTSTRRFLDVKPGFDPANLLVAEVSPSQSRYAGPRDLARLYGDILTRVREVPGVTSASIVTSLPLSNSYLFTYFTPEGPTLVSESHTPLSSYHVVDANYLKTMKIPLLRGRNFDERDTEGAPMVALISQSMAKNHWPNQDSLGKRIKLGALTSSAPWVSVIGVAGDTTQIDLATKSGDDFYLHYLQRPPREANLVLRTVRDPLLLTHTLETQVQSVEKELPLANVRTMHHILVESVAPQRISAILLASVASIGLLLASVGIYGLLFHTARRRTRELGVRIALGALPVQIIALMLTQSLKLLAAGLVAGVIVSFAVAQALQSLLFSVGAFDAVSYLVASATLLATGLLASFLPALYAARINPAIAFKVD